jgi:hypothetical protein
LANEVAYLFVHKYHRRFLPLRPRVEVLLVVGDDDDDRMGFRYRHHPDSMVTTDEMIVTGTSKIVERVVYVSNIYR